MSQIDELKKRVQELEDEVHVLRNQMTHLTLTIDSTIAAVAEDEEEVQQISPENLPDVVEAFMEELKACRAQIQATMEAFELFRTENDLDTLDGFDELAVAIEG